MDTKKNAANQVVSVGADIAFDADPKFFACLVRFESSSVPTTLPTAYDVYPLDGRHDGGYYTVKDCVTIVFFQAEAGIRDLTVTGVQTCALPILGRQVLNPLTAALDLKDPDAVVMIVNVLADLGYDSSIPFLVDLQRRHETPAAVKQAAERSEERRVGKSVDLGGRRIIKKKKKRT